MNNERTNEREARRSFAPGARDAAGALFVAVAVDDSRPSTNRLNACKISSLFVMLATRSSRARVDKLFFLSFFLSLGAWRHTEVLSEFVCWMGEHLFQSRVSRLTMMTSTARCVTVSPAASLSLARALAGETTIHPDGQT